MVLDPGLVGGGFPIPLLLPGPLRVGYLGSEIMLLRGGKRDNLGLEILRGQMLELSDEVFSSIRCELRG